ncbi:MAG: hypothetical protein QW103_01555 [Candidatus Pacearchaeota archaeon]
MKVRLKDPKKFIDAINIISELVVEVKIKFSEEGISIDAVDPANVAMIIFKVPKESFSLYETENEEISINLEDLKRILKRAYNSNFIEFEQEDNSLKIYFEDSSKRIFNLSLIDNEIEQKKEPVLDFSSEGEISTQDFSQTIEDCYIVADSCAFISRESFFRIEAKGSLSSVKVDFSKNYKFTGEAKAKYSLEYLMKFIKAGKIAEKVKIMFSNNYPLKLIFAGENLGISFILAPRVDND